MTGRLIGAAIGFVVLTLACLASAYQMLFSLWMTAYPKADITYWRPHFYMRLLQMLIVGCLWLGSVLWMFAVSRSDRTKR
jgi:hypothetical protein